MSDWKLRSRVDNMHTILKASKEPALLMKKLLQQLMKQERIVIFILILRLVSILSVFSFFILVLNVIEELV